MCFECRSRTRGPRLPNSTRRGQTRDDTGTDAATSHWMRANFADHCAEEDQIIKTDLINANALISKARSVGLLTEYVGPDATFYF